ncbi:MAG: rhodanese-like domain-containing protein [Candidatus Parabeggiatoa sp. nov. 3]|nr:MAG: rhodanese-like domain-containing protein [Gammaproteobacteria bacterium]RKZ59047.1 MAG: rhodanese-like domain-containing protein [Gammaproteobacteria bacterium]RKZ82138.1 MAG: rhodanese-like domain-containing protein [Gammaproteobacteria bacterium]
MKSYQNLVADCLKTVEEIYPWDLQESLETEQSPMLLDIREPDEFEAFHIKKAMNVPRGILEAACDYGYDETVPDLVMARENDIIVICRSGNRSILAAHTMQLMGYQSVKSLKTGVKGWNDYELPLLDIHKQIVDIDEADTMLLSNVKPEQMPPKKTKPMPKVVVGA